MAREPMSDGSGRARRASPSLEPSRSSVRRVNAHRKVATRPSVPPRELRESPSSAPRNRRVARQERKGESGAALFARMAVAVASQSRALAQAAIGRGRALGSRMRGPSSIALRLLGLCALVGGILVFARFLQDHLKTAPAFAIDTIEITGVTRIERAELLETAGIDIGVNVFERSSEDVRARLLRHPWIVSAQVNRRLPSRFEIVVREREPVALLVVESCGLAALEAPSGREQADDAGCDEPSSLYLVSDEAKMFKRLGGKDPVDLPVITGLTRPRLAREPELSQRVLAEAVGLMHEYQNSGLSGRLSLEEIHLEPNDAFSLYVGDDLTYVRLGVPPYGPKLGRMKQVFDKLESTSARAEYIYLDNEQRPDRVPVRLR